MYAIDFLTATPFSVIERSMACHSSTLAERLIDAARTHGAYASTSHNAAARAIALGCYEACTTAASMVYSGDINAIMSDMNRWIPAFHIACDLQLVPRNLRSEIAVR